MRPFSWTVAVSLPGAGVDPLLDSDSGSFFWGFDSGSSLFATARG